MNTEKANRDRKVTVRFTGDEYEKIEKSLNASMYRKLSDYLRSIVFNKPIIQKYRNQSLDEFMAEMILLRAELNHIGNNFNQAVKRLHTIKESGEFQRWLPLWEGQQKQLEAQIEQIKERIQQFAEKWLQE